MNRPAARAAVLGRCATWRCVCRNPIALFGRPGPVTGPTHESVIVCDRCERAYFVIPRDSATSPPVEVVELLGLPEESPAPAPPPDPPATPPAVIEGVSLRVPISSASFDRDR